jgi:hypothetical protein
MLVEIVRTALRPLRHGAPRRATSPVPLRFTVEEKRYADASPSAAALDLRRRLG